MSLQGSLRSLSIPDLFSILHQHKKTGVLSLVSQEDERGILFFKGDLVFATARDSSRRLGTFLVSLGFLNEGDLGRTAGARDWGVTFLGQELVKRGAIKPQELHAAVRKQILDILDEALLWQDGAFHFDEWDDPSLFEIPTKPVIGTQNILLEAIRRYDESQLIRQSFPDLAVVLKTIGEPAVAAGDEAIRGIFALIDGKRSVAQLLRDSPRSPYETTVLLTSLSTQGLLMPVPERGGIKDMPSLPEPWTFPVAPDTPARLSWIFRQKGTLQKGLFAEEVGRDPLLAAKVLQQFSLSRMVLPREKLSVPGIVESLGDFRIRGILIPEMVRGFFFPGKDYFWDECRQHAILSGKLCRSLAEQVGYTYLDEAFLAGLLSNLGIFILIGAYPDRYRRVLEEARRTRGDISKVEEAEFGISHVTIGGIYAEKWKYPMPVLQAIKLHHEGSEKGSPILDLVALSNWLSRERLPWVDFSENEEDQVEGALRRFKLKRRKVIELVENGASEQLALSRSS